MGVDPHRLAEERSIAYHRTIARRMAADPRILEQARRRVREWLDRPGGPAHHATAWDEILAGDLESIVDFLGDPAERARELRQSSPFAGALTAEERWQIWRRARFEGGSDR
jgi:hypothetical protein